MPAKRKLLIILAVVGVGVLHGWTNRHASGGCDGACTTPYEPLTSLLEKMPKSGDQSK